MIVSCDFCKKDMYIKPSKLKTTKNHFCSKNCKNKWQKENAPRGANHPNWKEKTIVYCNFCGKKIIKHRAWVKKSKNHFCNIKCFANWRSNNTCGKNSPRWNSVLISCDLCDKEFYIPKYKTKNKHHFCCNDCYFKWLKNNGRPYVKDRFKDKRIKIKCDYCEKIIEIIISKRKKQKHMFCNKKCYNAWQKQNAPTGKKNKNWNGVQTKCAFCKKEIFVILSRYNKYENNFCNMNCFKQWKMVNQFGNKNPRWNSVKKICRNCGKEFFVKKSYIKTRLFCCEICFFDWLQKHPKTGNKNPNWRAIEEICDFCEKKIYVTPYRKELSKNHFCNKQCFDKWSKKHKPRGSNSPIWKGGSMPYYGPQWSIQKKKILKRANYCSELSSNNGSLLDVHHIIPMRIFIQRYIRLCLESIPFLTPGSFRVLPYDLFIPNLIFNEANHEKNLICLTRSEHAEFEGMPLSFFNSILQKNKKRNIKASKQIKRYQQLEQEMDMDQNTKRLTQAEAVDYIKNFN